MYVPRYNNNAQHTYTSDDTLNGKDIFMKNYEKRSKIWSNAAALNAFRNA